MKKREDKGTAKKKQTGQDGQAGKMMVAGGSFIRAHYKLPPLGEDIKNAIVALFQFVTEGAEAQRAGQRRCHRRPCGHTHGLRRRVGLENQPSGEPSSPEQVYLHNTDAVLHQGAQDGRQVLS